VDRQGDYKRNGVGREEKRRKRKRSRYTPAAGRSSSFPSSSSLFYYLHSTSKKGRKRGGRRISPGGRRIPSILFIINIYWFMEEHVLEDEIITIIQVHPSHISFGPREG